MRPADSFAPVHLLPRLMDVASARRLRAGPLLRILLLPPDLEFFPSLERGHFRAHVKAPK